MTLFEYELFELSDYKHPAMRYRKIMSDINALTTSPAMKAIAEAARDNMELLYDEEDLALVTDDDEREYWVRYLGKKAAIELVTTNRIMHNTMDRISKLDDEDFDRAVALCTVMAKELDSRVKAAEAVSQNQL